MRSNVFSTSSEHQKTEGVGGRWGVTDKIEVIVLESLHQYVLV